MKTTIRKFGHSLAVIIPNELNPDLGTKYKIVKLGDTFVLTPLRHDLFANETDWVGFRKSITLVDRDWDG
ncbi:antitoxin MazE [Lactiplantibacillus nangangensis]|uniref:Antitoxin MazE n=1 Tax=Lactiplantibacillus nangangensis TaxID=2559917 RepID=A0ABW1SLC9_9LACO|nr:antitoxin MazE [Lactiplantibacillus nangangensis]